MKTKVLALLALLSASTLVYGQGTINFSTVASGVNAPATNILDGTRVAGTSFLAQLYWGPQGSAEGALISVTNTPRAFGTGGQAGYIFNATAYVLPGTASGETYSFQVRAWQAALGPTWEAAFAAAPANPTMVLGKSAIVNGKLGGGTTPAGNLLGLPGFYLSPVPEPGVIALGVIGLAALLWRRRK